MFIKKAPIYLLIFAVFFFISFSAFKKNNIYNHFDALANVGKCK